MKTMTTFDPQPEPEPQHQQRQEYQPRRGVERGDERIEHGVERARAADQDAERQSDHDRQAEAEREARGADAERRPDRAGREQPPQRAGDLARRGEEQLGAGATW